MSKYNRCLVCGSKPNFVLEGNRQVKRKTGTGWSLVCPICLTYSSKRGVTKVEAIKSWNEDNTE